MMNVELFNLINKIAEYKWIGIVAILFAEWIPYAVAVYSIYNSFKRKEYRYALLSSAIGLAINIVIGSIYFHPRPFALGIGTQLIEHSNDSSFPSDHTTVLLSLSLYLIYNKETKKEGIILTIVSILVGIARIMCGVHFPYDIVGSTIIAIVSSRMVKERIRPSS